MTMNFSQGIDFSRQAPTLLTRGCVVIASVVRVPAVPDLDLARIRKYCDSRVPARLRDEVRIEAVARGKSVTIFDCRPPWRPDLSDWSRAPVAQLRYDPNTHLWSLYWADRNGGWHRYEGTDAGTVDDLINEINKDATGIFWG